MWLKRACYEATALGVVLLGAGLLLGKLFREPDPGALLYQTHVPGWVLLPLLAGSGALLLGLVLAARLLWDARTRGRGPLIAGLVSFALLVGPALLVVLKAGASD